MKFHTYRDAKGEHRWRIVARNGRTVADSSEGYSSSSAAEASIRRLIKGVHAMSTVIDVSHEIAVTPSTTK